MMSVTPCIKFSQRGQGVNHIFTLFQEKHLSWNAVFVFDLNWAKNIYTERSRGWFLLYLQHKYNHKLSCHPTLWHEAREYLHGRWPDQRLEGECWHFGFWGRICREAAPHQHHQAWRMAGGCSDSSCLSVLGADLDILHYIRQEANRARHFTTETSAENGGQRKLQGKQEMRKGQKYPPGWDPEQLMNMTQEKVNKALVSYIRAFTHDWVSGKFWKSLISGSFVWFHLLRI